MSIAPDADTGEARLYAFAWNNAEWGSGEQYKAVDLGLVEPNTSYSAAMVHDSTDGTGTLKGYLNGELEGTVGNVPAMNAHGGFVGIGKVLNGSIRVDTFTSSGDGHEFQGSIGEIASWNSALSEEDISDLTNHATQGFGTLGGSPEGVAFDLNIATNLTDTDGSETVSYVVDGLPDGGALNFGTDNGDGTWSLSSEEVDVDNVGFDAGISGTDNADVIMGTDGDDLIFGEAGDDQIMGGIGADQLFGGEGNDTLSGGQGDDTLVGGGGNDIFELGENGGNDAVQGGEGWLDTLRLENEPGENWSLDLDEGSVVE